jgi:putative aminopeptidase FrvX
MINSKFKLRLMQSACSLLCMLPAISTAAIADHSRQLLQQLSDAPGASGFEGNVRKVLYPVWKRDLTAFKVDGVGNISGVIPGKASSPNVLLMSHMDEVGFMIRNITKDGFIQVEPIGGWRNQVAYAQRWKIMTSKGAVIGYSGEESGHIVPRSGQVTDASAATKMHMAREMYIDVGARSRKEAEEKFGLRPGLPITPDTKFTELNNSGRYLGKAFDDRAGAALLTELIEKFRHTNHPNRITVASTVQEEIGLRGAKVIAQEYKPDVAINVEACIAGDHPYMATPSTAIYPALGKGPCVYVYERTMLPNNELVEWVAALAKKNNIPFQYASAPNYGQDGSVVQQSHSGVPTILIGIPVRYAHQQSGVIERSDYDATLKLLEVILKNLDEKQVKLLMPS